MTFSLTRFFLCAALAAALFPADGFAQSRPGGAARSTASSTRPSASRGTNTRSNTGSGTTRNTTTNGQHQYRSSTEIGDAIIQIDPETRSLVIVTDEETHRELETVIKDLDQPKPQVLIKVVFLELTYNNALDIGVEGMYTFRLKDPVGAVTGSSTTTTNTTRDFTRSNGTTGTTTGTSTLTSALGSAAKVGETAALNSLFAGPAPAALAGSLATAGFVSDDWNLTLRALAAKGKVNVLSRPSIMARNNQEAVIVVGQEVPFITNSRVTDQGQTINTIQYDNVGIILRVTPFITRENTVEMIVAPEISTLNTIQTVPISNGVNAPTIDKRSAETVVVTPHGQTVVIGGLMQTTKNETVQKIPILGDIPLLGLPFKRTIREDQKRELMIFLTPYIVNDSRRGAAVAQDEFARGELSARTVSDPEFAKFLDDLPLPSDGAKANPAAPAATPAPARKAPAKSAPPRPITTKKK